MKFRTTPCLIFIAGNGGQDWTVVKSMDTLIRLELPEAPKATCRFVGHANLLESWCLNNGYQYEIREVSEDFDVAFEGTVFKDLPLGAWFTRQSCGQKMIRVPRQDNTNAIVLTGSRAGDRYGVSEYAEVILEIPRI